MKFILDNLFLVVIALVSGGLLVWPLIRKGAGSASLTSLEATQLINHRNAIVVDVRDEKDFAAGSLAGARHLPFADLATRAAELVRFKARPVLIVCAAGQQSARAVATFKAQGFDEAYSLAGGIAAWKQAGLPLVQAGRDSGRAPVKDPSRKPRNDQRNRPGRQPRRDGATRESPKPAVDVLSDAAPDVPAAIAVPAAVAANDETPPPDRLKERS